MAGLLYCLPLSSNWLQTENEDTDQSSLHEAIACLNADKRPLVLSAESGVGKTILLFQAGVAYANQEYHVTLISRQPLPRIPLSIHGMIRPDMAGKLQTLTFLYMNNVSDLVDYCAHVHTKSIVADVLIIDDLDFYLNQLKEPSLEAGCAKLCAILSDTLAFIRTKSSVGVMMASCSKAHNHWNPVFSQFNFSLANITVTEKEERKYKLDVSTDKVTATINYQLKNSGAYLMDFEAEFTKEVH